MTLHLTLTNFGWVCLPLEYVNAVLILRTSTTTFSDVQSITASEVTCWKVCRILLPTAFVLATKVSLLLCCCHRGIVKIHPSTIVLRYSRLLFNLFISRHVSFEPYITSYSYIYICYCLWRWQTVNKSSGKKVKKNWFQWRLFRVDLWQILLSDWLSQRSIHQRRLWSSCITVHKRNIWLSVWPVFLWWLISGECFTHWNSVLRDRIRTTTTTTICTQTQRTQLHPKPHQHYPFQEHIC